MSKLNRNNCFLAIFTWRNRTNADGVISSDLSLNKLRKYLSSAIMVYKNSPIGVVSTVEFYDSIHDKINENIPDEIFYNQFDINWFGYYAEDLDSAILQFYKQFPEINFSTPDEDLEENDLIELSPVGIVLSSVADNSVPNFDEMSIGLPRHLVREQC